MATEQDLTRIDAAVREEMGAAVRFANESPFPKVETALTQMWPH
jgi:TPP-dependent pyruvate/acetoin dehydrogenase alpha subunit